MAFLFCSPPNLGGLRDVLMHHLLGKGMWVLPKESPEAPMVSLW